MKLIAHRGLLEGPNSQLENDPKQIERAAELGYDSEVDLWYLDGKLFLGHDAPTHGVQPGWLHRQPLWIHAKNLAALRWLTEQQGLRYFWHQNDDCVVTSNGYIWTYPEQPLTDRSIRLMPEWADPDFETIKETQCYAICTDWVLKVSTLLNS